MSRLVYVASYGIGFLMLGLAGSEVYSAAVGEGPVPLLAVLGLTGMKVAIAAEILRTNHIANQPDWRFALRGLFGASLDALLSVGGLALLREMPWLIPFRHIVAVVLVYGLVVILLPTAISTASALLGPAARRSQSTSEKPAQPGGGSGS